MTIAGINRIFLAFIYSFSKFWRLFKPWGFQERESVKSACPEVEQRVLGNEFPFIFLLQNKSSFLLKHRSLLMVTKWRT